MVLYNFAPYALGITYGLVGLVGLILYIFDVNSILLWSETIILLSLCGFYSGILLRNLKTDSNTDHLTNLWNRRYLRKILTNEISKVHRYNNVLYVAMIDIDNFKRINDTYGHAVGDELLIEITDIFRNSIRKIDTIARWGGDEFILVLPETNIDGAKAVLERIRTAVELKFSNWQVSVSIGFTIVNSNMDLIQVFNSADKALYIAKQTKNTIVMDQSTNF